MIKSELLVVIARYFASDVAKDPILRIDIEFCDYELGFIVLLMFLAFVVIFAFISLFSIDSLYRNFPFHIGLFSIATWS